MLNRYLFRASTRYAAFYSLFVLPLTGCGFVFETLENNGGGNSVILDTTTPATFTITGIEGGSDSVADGWFTANTNPTIVWNDTDYEDLYTVSIYEDDATTIACAPVDLPNDSSTHTFTGCSLTEGSYYRIQVIAKNTTSSTSTAADNNLYRVMADYTAPTLGGFLNPSSNTFTAGSNYVFSWNAATDTHSGVHTTESYVVETFDNASCTGSPLNVSTQTATSYNYLGLSDGNSYSIRISAKDKAGNISSTACSDSVTVDISAPANFNILGVTGGTDSTADEWLTANSDATVTWQNTTDEDGYDVTIYASDGSTVVCATANKAVDVTSHTFTGCVLIPGTEYKISVVAIDNGGSNVSATNNMFTFMMDYTAPTMGTYTAPASTVNTNSTSYVFSWNAATDAHSGLHATQSYQVELFSNGTCTGAADSTINQTGTSYNYTSLSDGNSYSIRVSARDKAGHLSNATCSNAVNMDSSAPAAFTITGATGSTESTADAWLTDNSDVTANWNDTTGEDSYDVTIYENDGTTVKCATQNVAAGSTSHTFTGCALTAGTEYKISVVAKDAANNSTSATNNMYVFMKDYTAPTLGSFTAPTSTVYITANNYDFTWNAATDAHSGLHATEAYIVETFDNGTCAGAAANTSTQTTTTFNYSGLSDGNSYSIRISAKDKAGNISSTSCSSTVVMDTTPPAAFTITGATGGTDSTADAWLTNGTIVTVNWNDTTGEDSYDVTLYEDDGTTVKCALANVAQDSTDHTFTGCTLTEGESYKIRVVAKDNAGNTRVATNSNYAFTVDTTAPTFTSFEINGGATYTNNSSVTLSFDVTGASEMLITNTAGCGTGSWESYATTKASWGLGQSNTTATVYVKFRDDAGNETSCQSASIIHDNIEPADPSFISSDPASPNKSSTPKIIGSASADTVTVNLYSNATCTSAIGTGTRADFVGTGITATVPVGATTSIYALAVDPASNVSDCVLLTNYFSEGMKIEVPIELIDHGLRSETTPATRLTSTLDTNDYDGTVNYYFEVVATNIHATNIYNIELLDSSSNVLATLAIPANMSVSNPGRYRASFTPTVGLDTYSVRIDATSAQGDVRLLAARIIVTQVAATKTKIWIPLIARWATDYANGSVDDTTSATYVQNDPLNYSIWQKDSSSYATLVATNPWSLEAVVSNSGNSTTSVILHNRTTNTPVVDSEVSGLGTSLTIQQTSFSNSATGFDDGDEFEVRIKTDGNTGRVHRAGLWLKLEDLSKAEVLYRVARRLDHTSATSIRAQRVLYSASNYTSPTIHFEAIGIVDGSSSGGVALIDTNTNDVGTAGTTVTDSDITYTTTKSRQRTSAITLTDTHRYITQLVLDSGTVVETVSAFIIIKIE